MLCTETRPFALSVLTEILNSIELSSLTLLYFQAVVVIFIMYNRDFGYQFNANTPWKIA